MSHVFIHGFACQPSMFESVIARAGVQAHLVLLPGHGPQAPLPTTTRFVDVVDELAGALARVAPFHLVGYSLGARVALALAMAHPSLVTSSLLIGVHPGLDDDAERSARRAWDEEQARRLERDGLARFVDHWEALPMFATQRALDDATRAAVRADRLAHRPEGLAWAMRVLGLGNMPPQRSLLSKSSRPVTLVTGAHDHKATDCARQLTARHIQHHIVADAGHNVVLEAPDALAALMAPR
jgi:2-succinyl-6-hydroxy-2,4-cyclohexadiene-1-carboxylate synthase